MAANTRPDIKLDFSCDDYAILKDTLLKSRKLDDNMIFLLNKANQAQRKESNFVHDKVPLSRSYN